MPKRNAAYMVGQRETIARAAWEVMLEKGLHDTSVRDICVRAGVSVGTFYNHFADRTDVFVAVCDIEHEAIRTTPPPASWVDYVDRFRSLSRSMKDRTLSSGIRVGYEFLAELTQANANSAGLNRLIDTMMRQYREPLANAFAAGEISLPLGLERTAELHLRLCSGTLQTLVCDHRLDPAVVIEDMIEAMGLLAGLRTDSPRPKVRKGARARA